LELSWFSLTFCKALWTTIWFDPFREKKTAPKSGLNQYSLIEAEIQAPRTPRPPIFFTEPFEPIYAGASHAVESKGLHKVKTGAALHQ